MKYEILIFDRNDKLLAVLDKASDIRIDESMNRAGRASFHMHYQDIKTRYDYFDGRNSVKIYRDGVAIWAGKILGTNVDIGVNTAVVTVVCVGWLWFFNRYEITTTYTSMGVGAMAWAMIDDAQNREYGDLGITKGTDTTTDTLDIKTYERKKIYEALVNLSESQKEIDFEIDADKKFNTYNRIGDDKSDTILTLGKNFKTINIDIDYSDLANYVTTIGDKGRSAKASSETSMQYYGRCELSQFEPNWKTDSTLLAKAEEKLRVSASANYDCAFEMILPTKSRPYLLPKFSDLSIGDIVTIHSPYALLTFHSSVRLYARTIVVGNDGEEHVTFKANKIV